MEITKRCGFSLIQVLVGAALLGVAVGSGIEVYLKNMRVARDLDQKSRAMAIALQEMEGIKRISFTFWMDKYGLSNGYYCYHFKGYDSDGTPLYGKDAIVDIKENGKSQWWMKILARDRYKKIRFNPMGIEEGWVYVYFSPIATSKGKKSWAFDVKVIVCWRDGKTIYGSDTNLNGNCENWWHWNSILGKNEKEKCQVWHGHNKVPVSPVEVDGEVSALF